jgi:cation transport regulator ChaC
MNAELHFTTTIQPGNRLDLPTGSFEVGQVVEVTVISAEEAQQKHSALEFIEKNSVPLRSYTSWEEMEREFQAERDAWDK